MKRSTLTAKLLSAFFAASLFAVGCGGVEEGDAQSDQNLTIRTTSGRGGGAIDDYRTPGTDAGGVLRYKCCWGTATCTNHVSSSSSCKAIAQNKCSEPVTCSPGGQNCSCDE